MAQGQETGFRHLLASLKIGPAAIRFATGLMWLSSR